MMVVIAVVTVQIPGVADLLAERAGNAVSSGGAGRADIWSTGLSILESHSVLGVGYANFPVANTLDIARASDVRLGHVGFGPHDLVIGTVAELGPVGLLLLGSLPSPARPAPRVGSRRGDGPGGPCCASLGGLVSGRPVRPRTSLAPDRVRRWARDAQRDSADRTRGRPTSGGRRESRRSHRSRGASSHRRREPIPAARVTDAVWLVPAYPWEGQPVGGSSTRRRLEPWSGTASISRSSAPRPPPRGRSPCCALAGGSTPPPLGPRPTQDPGRPSSISGCGGRAELGEPGPSDRRPPGARDHLGRGRNWSTGTLRSRVSRLTGSPDAPAATCALVPWRRHQCVARAKSRPVGRSAYSRPSRPSCHRRERGTCGRINDRRRRRAPSFSRLRPSRARGAQRAPRRRASGSGPGRRSNGGPLRGQPADCERRAGARGCAAGGR